MNELLYYIYDIEYCQFKNPILVMQVWDGFVAENINYLRLVWVLAGIY